MIKSLISFTSITVAFSWSSSILLHQRQAIFPRNKIYHETQSTSLFARKQSRPRRGAPIVENKPPMNEEIKHEEIRVVIPGPKAESKDETLGIMSKSEALAKAKELGGLDLILINPNGDPPVCKIVDYSKYRYMKEKKAKELKKNSKASEVKEVKMSYKIDVHDYDVRVKAATRFIKQGNRVKLTVMFKGREVQHDTLGFELLEKIVEDMTKLCVMDTKPKRAGWTLSCFISPRPEVMKAINQKKRDEEKAAKKKKEAKKDTVATAVGAAALTTAAALNGDEDGPDIASILQDDDDDDEEEDELLAMKSLDELLRDDDDDDDDDDDEEGIEKVEAQSDKLMNDLFG